MKPELRQFIEQNRFHRASVLRVGEMLPGDDAELDGLLAGTVAANDQKAFTFLSVATLSRQRHMDARHLVRGAMLLTDAQTLGCVAWGMHGDVAEHLLEALQHSRLLQECEATALFLAAAWCRHHREGKWPTALISEARSLARHQNLRKQTVALLIALALLTGDAGLMGVLRQRHLNADDARWKTVEEAAQRSGETFLARCRQPVLELVWDKPEPKLAHGTTMRRAVARVGRNDPCPCGSGRKYKLCCREKDQERLHHSSEVAGLTHEELSAEPETHLTLARLEQAPIHALAKFDPRKVPAELVSEYFFRLCAFQLFERAAEAFELLGYLEARADDWGNVVFFATRAGRKDVIRRLVALRPNPAEVEESLHLGAALLLAADDPAKTLVLLEEGSRDAVQSDKPENLQGFAYGLLFSRFRALGIVAARGMIPLLPRDMAASLFERLLEARDQLNLSPDDPFGDILDQRFAESETDGNEDTAELRKALEALDAKAAEVRQQKETLARLQREITLREKRAATSAPTAPASPVDECALHELREKVESLKSALKERHGERNELRRQLQKAHADLELLRQNSASATPRAENGDGTDGEEDLLLPPETAVTQPIRLIEFPRNFQQTLASVPRHVARGAMSMLGRIAAAEPAAFVGAVRLKACPDIIRQRIGSDHRLLFRLLPDRVQVVDLIPRQDLERRIKTLV